MAKKYSMWQENRTRFVNIEDCVDAAIYKLENIKEIKETREIYNSNNNKNNFWINKKATMKKI